MIQIGSKVQCKNRNEQRKRRANLKKSASFSVFSVASCWSFPLNPSAKLYPNGPCPRAGCLSLKMRDPCRKNPTRQPPSLRIANQLEPVRHKLIIEYMVFPGKVVGGVVVLEGSPKLPEGAPVTVSYEGPSEITAPVGKKRIQVPLVRTG